MLMLIEYTDLSAAELCWGRQKTWITSLKSGAAQLNNTFHVKTVLKIEYVDVFMCFFRLFLFC